MPGPAVAAFPLAVAGGGRRPCVVLPEALLVDTVGLKVTVRCGRGGAFVVLVDEEMLGLFVISGVDSVAVDVEAIVNKRRRLWCDQVDDWS